MKHPFKQFNLFQATALFSGFLLFPFSTALGKLNITETPFSEYNFPSQDCKLIQHHQSRIFVPANAFFLDDKLYQGEVHLKYREFVDQLDIVLNNIPMNYNENDRHHVLESGGMFELYAYGNGKQLSFAPHKKISVQLACNFDLTGGETFTFNKNSKSWNKNTPFANTSESNQQLSDNKKDLWGDNVWMDSELSQIMDDKGVLWNVRTVGVQTYGEIRDQSFKTINVDKMDFYNCDRILNEEAVSIAADFNLEGYKEKLNSMIYVVYKKRNAVLTYYPNQFATDFKLLPDEEFTIFTFSKDGKIAVLDDQFTSNFNVKLNMNKKVVFPMRVFANLPTTKQELAKLTGL